VLTAGPYKGSLKEKSAKAGTKRKLPTAKASAFTEAKKSKCRKTHVKISERLH
jgi:hypothetical protein